MYLCKEQDKLERLTTVAGGLKIDAEGLDLLCLQYGLKGEWPTLTRLERDMLLQRFLWARTLAATFLSPFRKADGTETGRMPYPNWEFEAMMIWLLVETWGTAENFSKTFKEKFPERATPFHIEPHNN
jgi:hypothetical protein